ncbi:hypothetical protein [Actinomyces sp. MRS3W]|uniref:hypothetical protein n=1 Tax=Actinomyces sp. MRS3W TaxID=2800796 RepID=UPI0028FD2E3D|nr:hypothetical protein [Actinomyces sp. MRS3W]MDU0349443.1 hypothetical protein [Actinomyces sp. MRS3W]
MNDATPAVRDTGAQRESVSSAVPPAPEADERMRRVLESAARLQQVVSGAVMVGGSAASLYSHHRVSFDHDHVLADLAARYDTILEAVEATDGWVLSSRHSQRPNTIMGSLDGVEAGLRQLRRARPLEVEVMTLDNGAELHVPTYEEAVRIKGWMLLQRRSVRDYLDVAALADVTSPHYAAQVLNDLDSYYEASGSDSAATSLALALASPQPRDTRTLEELAHYKGLAPQWQDWSEVTAVCRAIAEEMAQC